MAGIMTDFKNAAMNTSDKAPSLMECTFSGGRSHLFWEAPFESAAPTLGSPSTLWASIGLFSPY